MGGLGAFGQGRGHGPDIAFVAPGSRTAPMRPMSLVQKLPNPAARVPPMVIFRKPDGVAETVAEARAA